MSPVEIFVCACIWLLSGGIAFGLMADSLSDEIDFLDEGMIVAGVIIMIILGPFGLGWAVTDRVTSRLNSRAVK